MGRLLSFPPNLAQDCDPKGPKPYAFHSFLPHDTEPPITKDPLHFLLAHPSHHATSEDFGNEEVIFV